MENNIVYISFYTEGSYEKIINQYLIPSFKKFKLKYKVYKVPNLKNWDKNTRYKAKIILKALNEFKENLVFIDADATIESFPEIFYKIPIYYDLAFHYVDWMLLWRKIKGENKRQLATGTMWFNNNKNTKALIQQWIKEDEINSELEQQILQNLLAKWKDKLQIYNLPPEYCAIILHNGEIPYHYLKEKPIILHHQVSRKLKNNG